ncbi:hypothetical protein [Spartinivicinus poritis]|uniref:Periplasmic sensor domain-containing protein n=1 Tax=Spartinivicinus poritis TaxID=2994640 RepID=A0ABT5UGA7_9GAMM|nr:hypothetical protein [Spartinivicinus sp. A2-2]MDE1465425.1 hypothetical protein [Spartinivicinus sp. A2-2]
MHISNKYGRSPIARKLLFITVGVSTFIALLITLIQLAHDYYQDIKRLETTVEQIKITNVPSIAISLWDVDYIQTKIQLQSLMKIPEVKFVKITSTQTSEMNYGTETKNDFFIRTYKFNLTRESEDKSTVTDLGTLDVVYDLKPIYINLARKLGIIFFLNCLKTLTVSFVILFVFWRLVTSHLVKITEQLSQYNTLAPNQETNIVSDADCQGEISSLIDSINKLYSCLKQSNKNNSNDKTTDTLNTEFLADYCLITSPYESNMSRSLILRLNSEITRLLAEFDESKKNKNPIINAASIFSNKIDQIFNIKTESLSNNFIYKEDFYKLINSISFPLMRNHVVIENDVVFCTTPIVIKRLLWVIYYSIYNTDNPNSLKTSVYKKYMNIHILISYSANKDSPPKTDEKTATSYFSFYVIETFIQHELKGSFLHEVVDNSINEWIISFPSLV